MVSSEEEWTRVTPRRACSSQGYCVEILGLEGVSYQEGDVVMDIPSQPLVHGGFVVHAEWMSGSPQRKREIIDRVRGGLEVMGEWLKEA